MNEVYVVSAVRTAIGTFGGSLKDIPPAELASRVTAEAVRRASVAPADIGHVVFGQVVQTEPRDMYISRVAAVDAGIPVETPALTVNRLCGSGLQAIVSAAQSIKLGDCDVAVAGGVESMSRAPFQAPSFRWGTKMGSAPIVDVLDNALRDPFHRVLMGVTAENVAERHGITRDDQDALALESHRRASTASKAGYFKEQILGIEVKSRKGTAVFDADEHVRHDATAEDFKGLRPVFKRDGGSVTAGNASGINDGAAAVVLASEAAVSRLRLKPMARLLGYAHAGVEPLYMGLGPRRRRSMSPTWTSSNRTRHSPRKPARCRANSVSMRRKSIRTATGFRSATRSAPLAPSIRSRQFMSWPEPAGATRW
jgi:acetyl-CoA C-acetyltransferase